MEFSFLLLGTSLLAGVMTVFAPCVFTFLPVILGAAGSQSQGEKSYKKVFVIIASLAISVFVFSLILKASTALISIPQSYWEILSGGIILLQGILILYPELWTSITEKLGLSNLNANLSKYSSLKSNTGNILTGLALGPIFSSCSPTYGFIIGALLQSTFNVSLIYLLVYIFGLSVVLLAIGLLGQRLVQRLKWGTNPNGTFKRVLAWLFIFLGLIIVAGIHKDIEAFIIQNLPFLDVTRLDSQLLQNVTR